jgi:hypothetical protein
MTRLGVIEKENPQQCDLCGKVAELRPYGPNGECICFACGMKDEKSARRGIRRTLFGEKEPVECEKEKCPCKLCDLARQRDEALKCLNELCDMNESFLGGATFRNDERVMRARAVLAKYGKGP